MAVKYLIDFGVQEGWHQDLPKRRGSAGATIRVSMPKRWKRAVRPFRHAAGTKPTATNGGRRLGLRLAIKTGFSRRLRGSQYTVVGFNAASQPLSGRVVVTSDTA